jgi:hypothetical protein
MSLAGYPIKVYAKSTSATAVSGDEIAGINDATYEDMIDLLETTTFKSASAAAWKTRIGGLLDGSVELAGDFEPTDAPQLLLRTSKTSGASVWISIYFNPSATTGVFLGYRVECKVEKYTVKDGVGGKTEFSASLKFTGAPVSVNAP